MGTRESNRIRMLREQAGLSQQALANKVGTSQQQLQRIESGQQAARYDLAVRICAAFNMPFRKVFPKTGKAMRTMKAAAIVHRQPSLKIPSAPARALLVNATDLELWAKRLDAPAVLPQLLRRLALGDLPAIERIHFRSDEGIRLEGWDGIIHITEGNAFVPSGTSGWEIGTNKDVKGKADDDYAKRVADPLDLDIANSAFVFVTPRRWKNKEKWADARRREGVWKDVRVLDADDLATWLEQVPPVHIWFSILIGKRPSGVNHLQAFWQNWSCATQPPLAPELLVAGRKDAVDEIQKFLQGQPSTLSVQAATPDEAIAFFAAVIAGTKGERFMARALIVEDQTSWRQLTATDKPLILLPTFPERTTVAQASIGGHFVVIPLGQGEPPIRGGIQLARLRRDEAKKALEAMGIASDRAGNLAGLARRSMGALRRELAISPSVLVPKWAAPENVRSLLPALLAGRWSAGNSGDQESLARLAGKEYRQVQEVLIRWANEHDPPVRRVGDTWMFVSKEDGWSLLARYLSRDDLERFDTVARDVLHERDPKYDLPVGERWQANVKGKILNRSNLLREGLTETLAIMGAYSEAYPIGDVWTGQDWANHITRQLFDQAIGWHLWASLSSHLRLLAEAAPDSFLSAVENGLSGQNPMLAKLFTDTDNHFMESSPHTGLLWALEVLAWSPEYLGQAAVCMAKLAKLDPGGKLANRPINSLREVFLGWYPGTSANLEQRFLVLDTIRKREPQVAWTLLVSLLPKGHDAATPTAKPTWRDWTPEQLSARTHAEIYRGAQEIVRRLLEDVGVDGSRWHDLIEALDDLPKGEFDAIIERLQGIDLKVLSSMDRMRIWSSLRGLISRHLQFQEANWALPKEAVDRLEQVYPRFEPEDPVAKRKGLFSYQPDLPIAGYSDSQEREKAVAQAQMEAVEELFELGGMPMMLDLTQQVRSPHLLGFALGRSKILDDHEDELLNRSLGSSNAAWREMAMNFLHARTAVKGQDWVEGLRSKDFWRSWTPQQRADYYRCLPFTQRSSWDALEAEEAETQRLYWSQVGPFGHGDPQGPDCERAIMKFVEHGSLGSAVKFLDLYTHGKKARVRPQLVAEVLKQAMRGTYTEEVNWSSLAHEVGELLDFLEKSGEIADAQLAQLEWFFLPLLGFHGRPPRILHKALAEDPQFFVEVLKLIYRAEGQKPEEITEDQKIRGRLAFDLLYRWHMPPGLNKDGIVSPDKLHSWVVTARELAAASGRGKVADHNIGNVLSHYPAGEEGTWPHEALRNLLEELESEEIEEGIRIGIFNSRGVVRRSLTEGGSQEREISEQYQGYARKLNAGWPRTARLIKKIAQVYEADARREDIETEIREDLWD